MRTDVDYEFDEKKRTVSVLEDGITRVEDHLGIDNLYDAVNTPLISFLNNAIKAKELFRIDRDYIVVEGEVLIVDEHTGRVLHGRRYNEGLHQAIEAKEGVTIREEYQTLATITLQNYFRLYDKLGGMTGTAMTEASEFDKIYRLGVIPIPTNLPMIRDDQPDLVYRTDDAKYAAIVDDIAERHAEGQPVLLGTDLGREVRARVRACSSDAASRTPCSTPSSTRARRTIVAQAGRKGAVTVATNMAGRGTDIMLGGSVEFLADEELRRQGLDPVEHSDEYEAAWPAMLEKMKEQVAAEHDEVNDAGGLYVVGTERHESRRIDNQLRGRSGRQGDPGESRFYLSLEDDLMRLFKSDWVDWVLTTMKIPDDVPIENKRVTGAIASAQAPGREPELRDPQEHPQVRRRDVPPARGHLRRAPPGARGRRPARADPRHDRRHRRGLRHRRDRRLPGGVGPRRAVDRAEDALPGLDHAGSSSRTRSAASRA